MSETTVKQASLEPVVIEDLVRFGEERGERKAARFILRRVLAVRGLVPSAEDQARIEACIDQETLQRWFDQAMVAGSVAEALK